MNRRELMLVLGGAMTAARPLRALTPAVAPSRSLLKSSPR